MRAALGEERIAKRSGPSARGTRSQSRGRTEKAIAWKATANADGAGGAGARSPWRCLAAARRSERDLRVDEKQMGEEGTVLGDRQPNSSREYSETTSNCQDFAQFRLGSTLARPWR